jgi:phenylpropionate dioxygenase-like ring-hydroxylating dioxygenase large terminal subunit
VSDDPLGEPPRFDEYDAQDWQPFKSCPSWDVAANICASVENFRDVAHLPFVHRATMGEIAHEVEPLKPRRERFDVYLLRRRAQADPTTAHPLWTATHREPQDLHYHAIAPSAIGLLMSDQPVGKRMLLFAVAPSGLDASRWFLVASATHDYPLAVDDLLDVARRITDEDVAILEGVRPRDFSGMSRQVHCTADAYTLKYREAFMAFIGEAAGSAR